eukprot:SAG11_NODE_29413_length_311_cov_0.702830_1_plen_73_part_10
MELQLSQTAGIFSNHKLVALMTYRLCFQFAASLVQDQQTDTEECKLVVVIRCPRCVLCSVLRDSIIFSKIVRD